MSNTAIHMYSCMYRHMYIHTHVCEYSYTVLINAINLAYDMLKCERIKMRHMTDLVKQIETKPYNKYIKKRKPHRPIK